MLLPAVQSKCLTWQLNLEAFIHSVSVLVNISAQPRVNLHQKQMVLPTLPTCLKAGGRKSLENCRAELEMSQAISQLFCNSALTGQVLLLCYELVSPSSLLGGKKPIAKIRW